MVIVVRLVCAAVASLFLFGCLPPGMVDYYGGGGYGYGRRGYGAGMYRGGGYGYGGGGYYGGAPPGRAYGGGGYPGRFGRGAIWR